MKKKDMVERVLDRYSVEEIRNFLHHNPYGFQFDEFAVRPVREGGKLYLRGELPDGEPVCIPIDEMMESRTGIPRELILQHPEGIRASVVYGRRYATVVMTIDPGGEKGELVHLGHLLMTLIEMAHLSDPDELEDMIVEADVLGNILHMGGAMGDDDAPL